MMTLVNGLFKVCPLDSINFVNQCRQKLSELGILLIPQFLQSEALRKIIKESEEQAHLAYFTKKPIMFICQNLINHCMKIMFLIDK